jgi:hypothetical protein
MKIPALRRNPQVPESLICSQLVGEAVLAKVEALQQQILETPGQTRDPLQALLMAYRQLSDPYKIAFLLAGGTMQLLYNQRKRREDVFSDPTTEDLPALS